MPLQEVTRHAAEHFSALSLLRKAIDQEGGEWQQTNLEREQHPGELPQKKRKKPQKDWSASAQIQVLHLHSSCKLITTSCCCWVKVDTPGYTDDDDVGDTVKAAPNQFKKN